MVATDIESILHYHFKDPALLEEALQAAAVSTPSTSQQDPRKHGNKALAMIGDAVLKLVVVDDGIVGGKSRQDVSLKLFRELPRNLRSRNVE
ncbi:hypothetical protein MKX08_001708 [Trichoderma sp. CBMAI-0020]|nr:hypothetical protein MKX08_001708 [Trichoderma sp. CBMAI-0020]